LIGTYDCVKVISNLFGFRKIEKWHFRESVEEVSTHNPRGGLAPKAKENI